MRCPMCFTINDDDAVFCKSCGYQFSDEEISSDTKVKKQRGKKGKSGKSNHSRKVVRKKNKPKKNNKGMTFVQKVIMFFMILLIIILFGVVGVFGYYYYTQNNVSVPDVMGMEYDSARIKLIESGFKVSKKDSIVDDKADDNLVLSQSKKAGSKAISGSTIKLSVGKYEYSYILGNYVGMNIDDVTNELDKAGTIYKITYKNSDEDGIVLKQSPGKGKSVKKDGVVYLVVGQISNTSDNDSSTDDGLADSSLNEDDNSDN